MSTKPEQQPEALATLYHRAFAGYRSRALWSRRELEMPTPADALVVARALRAPSRSSCLANRQFFADEALLRFRLDGGSHRGRARAVRWRR